jgi:hypothetical protein
MMFFLNNFEEVKTNSIFRFVFFFVARAVPVVKSIVPQMTHNVLEASLAHMSRLSTNKPDKTNRTKKPTTRPLNDLETPHRC